MFFSILLPQIIQIEEGAAQTSPADRLTQATHGAGADSACFNLHWRTGFSYFPLHKLMIAREHLGQDGTDMKKDRPLRQ